MDTSVLQKVVDVLAGSVLHDVTTYSQASTYYTGWFLIYTPYFLLKWVFTFLPIFLLIGGVYGSRSGNSQD
jgi:hypothetical protein